MKWWSNDSNNDNDNDVMINNDINDKCINNWNENDGNDVMIIMIWNV